jgi:hypothetical protein
MSEQAYVEQLNAVAELLTEWGAADTAGADTLPLLSST